jgi:heptosyltransferase-1
MRVLVIKTSSLGDVIHTLPALSDAVAAIPGIRFDWVVEEAFAEIPAWHPAVDRAIPVALRRWRKAPLQGWRSGEMKAFYRSLRSCRYDCVIDAQGLLKSALITAMTRGPSFGLDRRSARESLACIAYGVALGIERDLHAITRTRMLFSSALGYAPLGSEPNYGLEHHRIGIPQNATPYLVFLHGTTWPSKHYPESHWRELARLAGAEGYRVVIPWGNDAELSRAQRLARDCINVEVLDKRDLSGLARLLAGASGVFAVDTGLAHLSSALEVPGVVLYGPTNVELTGVMGEKQRSLQEGLNCVPCLKKRCVHPDLRGEDSVCMSRLDPKVAFSAFSNLIKQKP